MEHTLKCAAFLFDENLNVSNNNTNSFAKEIAHGVGFSSVLQYNSLAQVEKQSTQTPICFFLFEQVSDISQLNKIMKQLRTCKRHNVRFFPLIYLCDFPSPEIITQCISMGFDDIITKPTDEVGVKKRLSMQLERPLTYYETDGFFGPDRRRIAGKNQLKKTQQRGIEKCLQYKFERNTKEGISIISKTIEAA